MTGYALTYAKGVVAANVNSVLLNPRGGPKGKRLVVVAHGFTSDALSQMQTATNSRGFMTAMAQRGHTLLAVDTGDTFGNSTGTTLVEACRLYAASIGAATDKVCLIGVSMGNWTALGYRRDYPTRVAGVIGIEPGSDMNDVRNNNRAGARVAIETAWGIISTDPLPAAADPLTNASAVTPVDWHGYYTTSDVVVLPSTVAALASVLGGTTSPSGSDAHGDGILDEVPVDEVSGFLTAWGA